MFDSNQARGPETCCPGDGRIFGDGGYTLPSEWRPVQVDWSLRAADMFWNEEKK